MKVKTKSKKVNKSWLNDHVNDPYVKLAQQKGYRARAAFKLSEILDLEKIQVQGKVVVDLGSTPGSWSQVAALESMVRRLLTRLSESSQPAAMCGFPQARKSTVCCALPERRSVR